MTKGSRELRFVGNSRLIYEPRFADVEQEAEAYHLQVFRDPKLRHSYRSSLDVISPDSDRYEVPFDGIYSPGATYYWRMRSRNDKDISGDWGHVAEFAWEGPRVQADVKLAEQEGVVVLTWRPNPRGERPAACEVYG